LFQLAAEENTTPYAIHTYPYTGKDITRGMDPDTKLEDLQKKFVGGKAELKICPGEMKFISTNSCLNDLYSRQPCKNKVGNALYECLCSFRPDGIFRDPYDGSLSRIYTCKGWQLVKADKCPTGQVAGPEDYFDPSDPTYTPCVPRPSGTIIRTVGAPCMSLSCMCQSYLLPRGFYRNPWDLSQKTALFCDTISDKSLVMVDFNFYACENLNFFYSAPAGGCIESTRESLRSSNYCNAVLDSDGKCDLTNLPDISCNGPRDSAAEYLALLDKYEKEATDLGRRLASYESESAESSAAPAMEAAISSAATLGADLAANGTDGYGQPSLTSASGPSRHLLGPAGKALERVNLANCDQYYAQHALKLKAVYPQRSPNNPNKFPAGQCINAKTNKKCAVLYRQQCPYMALGLCKGERLVRRSDRCKEPTV